MQLCMAVEPARARRQGLAMGVLGWILIAKGALFLFGARHVVEALQEAHPVTFGHVTRGENGLRRYAAGVRGAGFVIALIGALVVWLAS
jgi:hypothetical protein